MNTRSYLRALAAASRARSAEIRARTGGHAMPRRNPPPALDPETRQRLERAAWAMDDMEVLSRTTLLAGIPMARRLRYRATAMFRLLELILEAAQP